MPTITVIVPVYNVEKYLDRCIESILSQTYTDFELILVDDGSPDNCPSICDDWAGKDSRIVVIHQTNQGQSVARNNAISCSKGEWICFVDSDDLIHPQMLERLVIGISNTNVRLCTCDAIESDVVPENFYLPKTGEISTFDINEEKLNFLYDKGNHRCWVVWGKLIHRDIIKAIPFTPGRIYEDNAVVCRWLYRAGTIANTTDQLYFYSINSEGTTKSKFSLKKLDYLWALEEKIRFYSGLKYRSLQTRFCSEYLMTSVRLYYQVSQNFRDSMVCKQIQTQMKKIIRDNRKYVKLSKSLRISVAEILIPKIMRVYKIAHLIKKRFKKKEDDL